VSLPDVKPHEAAIAVAVERARAIVVSDRASHAEALAFLSSVVASKRNVEAELAPTVEAAHAAHKAATALRARLVAGYDAARAEIQPRIIAFEDAERRRAEDEARALQAAAVKAEEDARLAMAQDAENYGHDDAAAAILEAPIVRPYIAPVPQLADTAGTSRRVTYSVVVEDRAALLRFAAASPAWAHLMTPNMTALNGLARSQREALSIPGVRVVKTAGLTVR